MPNTPVPAAGEAVPAAEVMPIIGRFSRRALLGAIAAVPAVMVTTTVVASPVSNAFDMHPDAELFRLDREMEEAEARMKLAEEVEKKTHRKCAKLYPPEPPVWKEPQMPDDVRAVFDATTVRDMIRNQPAIYVAWSKGVEAQRAAWKAMKEAHLAKIDEIDRKVGLGAVEDAYGESVEAMWQVGERIFATPAYTLDGMVIKIRAADRMGQPEETDAFVSIAADIRRLAQEATS